MQTTPWHLRRPDRTQYLWFNNLVELHELTTQWLKELQVDRPSHLLSRGLPQEVSEHLWMLESLADTRLESYLEDSQPQDLLTRLEHTVWTAQAWTLSSLLERMTRTDRGVLDSVLGQVSWKQGKKCAENRWKHSRILVNGGHASLEALQGALLDCPVSGFPHRKSYLIERATPQEVQVELLACPHAHEFAEIRAVADDLCLLHLQWTRGYVYALNHRVTLEQVRRRERCQQTWTLQNESKGSTT